jgi:hypothetical protein
VVVHAAEMYGPRLEKHARTGCWLRALKQRMRQSW